MAVVVRVVEPVALAEVARIVEERLSAFNVAAVEATGFAPSAAERLVLGAYDDQDLLAGGLTGWMYWGFLAISLLHVRDGARGLGVGGALLDEAERVARAAGCHTAHLDTFTFQAPGFYRRRGYEVFGELEGFPGGHRRVWLKKALG